MAFHTCNPVMHLRDRFMWIIRTFSVRCDSVLQSACVLSMWFRRTVTSIKSKVIGGSFLRNGRCGTFCHELKDVFNVVAVLVRPVPLAVPTYRLICTNIKEELFCLLYLIFTVGSHTYYGRWRQYIYLVLYKTKKLIHNKPWPCPG